MIDYHLHTPLCNHAQGELGAYILQAIKLGLKEICFLDHLTISECGKNLSMELNTSGYNHQTKEVYPSREIIEKCVKLDIGLTLGSDAHRPEEVGRHYDRALALLKASGESQLAVFKRRKPERIPIAGVE